MLCIILELVSKMGIPFIKTRRLYFDEYEMLPSSFKYDMWNYVDRLTSTILG